MEISIWYLVGGAVGIVYLLISNARLRRDINIIVQLNTQLGGQLDEDFMSVHERLKKVEFGVDRLDSRVDYLADNETSES